jgi:hypothetical protein
MQTPNPRYFLFRLVRCANSMFTIELLTGALPQYHGTSAGGHRMGTNSRFVLAGVLLSAGQVVWSHHSFAMFDGTKKIALTGKVKKMEWSNPHVWIQLPVPDPGGGSEKEWSIEAPAINGLARVGWTSKSLQPGDKVTIYIHPLRNGEAGGALQDAVLANGQHLGKTEIQKSRDQSGN